MASNKTIIGVSDVLETEDGSIDTQPNVTLAEEDAEYERPNSTFSANGYDGSGTHRSYNEKPTSTAPHCNPK